MQRIADLVSRFSHNTLLTFLVVLLFLPIMTGSFLRSLSEQIDAEREQLGNEMKRNLALLTRSSERLLTSEPALLKEYFSQIISDSRVKSGAIINSDGSIWHGKSQEWKQRAAIELFPADTVEFIRKAAGTRQLLAATSNEEADTELFAKSFDAPTTADLRQKARGVIFFSCDLTTIRKSAFDRALKATLVEAIVLSAVAMLLWALLRGLVSRPLRQIDQYVRSAATSNETPVELNFAPRELKEVASTIYSMRREIMQQLIKVREESELNNLILDNTDDGFIIIDRSGHIVLVSRPVTTIFGYTAGELNGRNISMLMPSPNRENHDGYLQAYQNTGVKSVIGNRREVQGLRKNGEIFKLELRVQEFSRKNVTFYVGSVRDISEKDALEKAKSEFVSIVSHELRTPLTSIIGSIDLILGTSQASLPGHVNQLLQIAKRNGQRLLSLIGDLLDMEKIMTGNFRLKLTKQYVKPLVQNAIELLANYSQEKQVSVQFNASTDASVNVDTERFNQVIANLLSNAIKFSPPDSTVTVAMSDDGERVRIDVIDQGEGIPESFRHKIFQKFAQADSSDTRQKGGTGLGLAITRELVQRMGGSIDFVSETGRGTTFTVEIPVARPTMP